MGASLICLFEADCMGYDIGRVFALGARLAFWKDTPMRLQDTSGFPQDVEQLMALA